MKTVDFSNIPQSAYQETLKPIQKTYAAVTQNVEITKTNNEQEKQKWTTPKTSKKLETVNKINNFTDPKEAMRQLKEEIEGSGSTTDDGF